MKSLLIISFVLFAIFSIQFCVSAPVYDEEDVIYVNDTRCGAQNSTQIVYASFSNDTSKYIQCIGSGVGIVKSCLPGTGFNESQVSCVFQGVSFGVSNNVTAVVSNNVTVGVVHNVSDDASKRGFSLGQLTGVVCKNGGVINYHASMGDCICLQNYSGHICENQVEVRHSHYAEILNGSFCVEKFVEEESLVSDNETHDRIGGLHLSNFTVHFQNVSANFEELLITLVDEIWSEISPEQAFLRDFNYSCISKMSERQIGSLAQKLKFYAKHVVKNFESNFYVYKDVLSLLHVHLVNRSSEVKVYAIKFIDEWNKNWVNVQNDTFSVGQVVEQGMVEQVLNTSQVINKMRDGLNQTYGIACHFYHCVYNHTHNEHGSIVESESNEDLVHQVQGVIEQIRNATCKNWNMVVDYGFWFLTNRLANDQSGVVGRFAYNRKFWKRDEEEQNELFYPVGI
jgi:hypothetical protein